MEKTLDLHFTRSGRRTLITISIPSAQVVKRNNLHVVPGCADDFCQTSLRASANSLSAVGLVIIQVIQIMHTLSL